MSKKIYKISGMNCESCAKMLELDFEDAGLLVKCNIASETLEVDDDKISENGVKEIVKNAGYDIV